MAILPPREPSARPWVMLDCIGPLRLSIPVWSKITVASSNGMILCAPSGPLKRRHACVVLSMSCAPLFVLALRRERWSLLKQRPVFLQRLGSLQTLVHAASYASEAAVSHSHEPGTLFCDLRSDRTLRAFRPSRQTGPAQHAVRRPRKSHCIPLDTSGIVQNKCCARKGNH